MGTTTPPPPEDAGALVALMIEEMRSQGVVGNIAHDRDNHRLINESIEPIDLHGLLRARGAAPTEAHADILHRYIAAHLRGRQEIKTWAEARTRVLPLLRPAVEKANWGLRQKLEGWQTPSMPQGEVTEHLHVRFVWEVEDGLAHVHEEDTERWGVTLDELQDAAGANLLERTPSPSTWLGNATSPGVRLSKWRDGFDATRVMFSGTLGIPSEGPLVAIAPSASELFVADSADEDALVQLGLIVKRTMNPNKEPVWLWPLLLDGEERRHWLPEQSSPAFAPLSSCAARHAQFVYNQHAEYLQRALIMENAAVRVGAVGQLESPQGLAVTVAIWDDGAPASVAQADLVQFQRDGQRLILAPWAKVVETMGPLLEAVPGYPPRFKGHLFPEDWQLEAMKLEGS
jgi:hypothetical protein